MTIADILTYIQLHDMGLNVEFCGRLAEVIQKDSLWSVSSAKFGEVIYHEVPYALTEQAHLTNRLFPGSWMTVEEGQAYTSEWEASAINEEGEPFTIRWQFPATKGQEPEDDGDWPWGNNYITSAIPE